MTGQLKACPKNWSKGCYPHPCHRLPVPQPPPNVPKPEPSSVHNVVYLVDEHLITSFQDEANLVNTRGSGTTLQARYAWHYGTANLYSFNVGEKPDTIKLDPKIADPKNNKVFRWDGFMFDIPADNSVLRVGIVAGAESADPTTLEGPGGQNRAKIDRVVGFAGTYPDPGVPFGPVVQVRRDDQYRQLGQSFLKDGKGKITWRCAYYITKDTPPGPTTPVSLNGKGLTVAQEGSPPEDGAAQSQSSDAQGSDGKPNYDQIMDQTIEDKIDVDPENENVSWGGRVFGVEWTDVDDSKNDNDPEYAADEPTG